MSKQQTTHSHTVPQMYLKNFANEKNQVWTYCLQSHKCFRQNIKNICVKNKTYEFTKDKVDNILENLLSKYESLWAPLLYNIINGQNILLKEDIEGLLYFCIIQNLRTCQGRKKLLSALQKNNTIKIKKNSSDINIENAVFLKSIELIEKIIQNYIVTEIKIYKTYQEIYTSDTPIIMAPSLSCIYCPLTSNSYITLNLTPKTTLLQYQNSKIIQTIYFDNYNFLDFNVLNFNYLKLNEVNTNYYSIMLFISQNCNYIIKKSEFTKEEKDFLKNLIIIPLS